MRVKLDQDRCVGSGQCVLAAPEVFDQREEDGIALVLDDSPAENALSGVRQAADLCPALAISLDEA